MVGGGAAGGVAGLAAAAAATAAAWAPAAHSCCRCCCHRCRSWPPAPPGAPTCSRRSRWPAQSCRPGRRWWRCPGRGGLRGRQAKSGIGGRQAGRASGRRCHQLACGAASGWVVPLDRAAARPDKSRGCAQRAPQQRQAPPGISGAAGRAAPAGRRAAPPRRGSAWHRYSHWPHHSRCSQSVGKQTRGRMGGWDGGEFDRGRAAAGTPSGSTRTAAGRPASRLPP